MCADSPSALLLLSLLCWSSTDRAAQQTEKTAETRREVNVGIYFILLYRSMSWSLSMYTIIYIVYAGLLHNYTAITQKNPCALLYLHLRMDNTTDDAKCFLEVDGASPISNDSAPQAAKMESMPSR